MRVREETVPYRPWKTLLGFAGTVAMLNAVVAVLAFVKDLLTAMKLGTSQLADAFSMAYFIPDTVGCNLIAASIGIACVPVFSRLLAQGEYGRLRQAVRWAVIAAGGSAALIAVLLFAAAPAAMQGWTGSGTTDGVRMLRVMLPIIPAAPLMYIGFALLQAAQQFRWPAGSWIVLHAGVTLAAAAGLTWSLPTDMTAVAMAAAASAGVVTMTIWTWVRVKSLMSQYPHEARPSRPERSDRKEIGAAFVTYLLISLGTHGVYVVERMLALQGDTGTVTGLNYAFRLSQLPISVFVLALSSVMLPGMSQDMALGRMAALQQSVGRALTMMLVIAFPTTILLFMLRQPIVALLFERGAFGRDSVLITAEMLGGYSLTITGLAVAAIAVRYFLASHKVFIPLIVSLLAAVLQIGADVYLTARVGPVGIAYGAAAGAVASGIALTWLLFKDLRLAVKLFMQPVLRIVLANVPVLLIGVIGYRYWLTGIGLEAMSGRLMLVAATLAAAAAAYGISLWKLNLLNLWNKEGV
ncbi:murein biosynthesis integral membrane protein MurJ [Paenibacillus chartarius]|uniref:Murein biosynthesis integral membrane protein MurJ n=1 Tax=Paenibacillus chartarius TaxID=747481 RepID=A0ABV6DRG2_9BACL